jgi:DNA-3-methyladenine glycosylase II
VNSVTFTLSPLPPFRLDLTVWALRRRPENAVDRWDGRTYRRVLTLGSRPVEVAVTQTAPLESARLEVTARGAPPPRQLRPAAAAALEPVLGLGTDLQGFYEFAADPRLGELIRRFRGLKPPRFPTLFEALANAIACQQVSLRVGILLLNRLAEARGLAVSGPGGAHHGFPRPEDLAGLEPEGFRSLGLSRQKGLALSELARSAGEGRLEGLEGLGTPALTERLRRLRGVGRWSAEYVLLRGLGRLDVFPGDDVGARNSLQRWLNLEARLDYAAVRAALARWQPFEGFLYFHLLLERLAEAGYLT